MYDVRTPPAATDNGPRATDHGPLKTTLRAVLLDLAGDAARARAWLGEYAPEAEIVTLDKAELKAGSKRDILARLRALRAGRPVDLFAIFCNRLDLQPARALMLLFGRMAGSRRVAIADMRGDVVERTGAGILFVELPLLALEMAAAYGYVVPRSWLALVSASVRARFRPTPNPVPEGSLDVLYLRATPAAGSMIGGSTSHISGMVAGLADLGHRVRFVANDRLPSVDHDRMPIDVVPPSSRFGTVRAVFEIWNALRFTAGALRLARRKPPDVVYQRYNRFNWTGVAVAAAVRRPLCLEFNGSEIWVAENWDPVGQRRLLAAVERLNLRAADRLFVVSDVLAHDCERAGVDRDRLVVNPNGVDPDRFRPGVGGDRIRRALGLDGRTVAGFVGTFGPWHGALVLAEAIARLPRSVDVTFLLVGDGDQRAGVERRLEEAGALDRVVFTGRVPHDDVPAYLDACDLLLSPHVEMPDGSAFFGSPTKLFEYLAAGKAVVASRLGQIADVIEEGVSGLLLPPGDADALAEAVTRLAADPELRARLGRAARERILTEYTWRRNAERVVSAVRAPCPVARGPAS
jgi:glycosyltransferase involved in cell wall biosynthesis